ncbi:MAG TPA: ABC transporter substrate-binding protein [Lachnospiraceae bacterium]|jgi:peptide/nickel transport system substrate-binding protein|nr:ABC transporter substrate-binding protein [Lachnospiraceae bacterium]
MKKRVFTTLLTSVLLALTIALGGCSGDKAGNSSQIIVGIPQDLEDSLDPHVAVAAGTKEVLFNMYEGLVKPDSDGNLVPAVASDYAISDDGKTYTFTLRDGIKFHNGNPVTVEDIQYSIEKCADTTNGEPLVPAYSMITAINTIDEKTIEIGLSEMNVDFLAYMTTAIIPADNDSPDTNPIGTGPYMYVSRSPQENFVLKRFDEYWGEKANIENVIFKVCANVDTIVMDLRGGSIDMFARLTSAQVNELGDGFTIYEGTMNLVQALYLNNAIEPFNDIRVRQAMSYAVNQQEIFDLTFDGKGTEIGSSMFPAFHKYYVPELTDVYNQDIDKAKELMKEAGYEDGFSMTITVPSNYQPHIDTAQVLVEQLKAINIDAKIELIEWSSWLSDVYADRNYESTVIGVDASELTARALLDRFESTAGNNFINYSNAEYDKLFAEAISSTDMDKQIELYKQMETILTEDAANVYIQDMAEFVALSDRFEGYTFYPLYVQDISKLKLRQ